MPKTPTDIASLARKHTALAIRVLKEVASSPKAQQSARVAAATALLNRGWGMPKQTLEHQGNPLAELYDRMADQEAIAHNPKLTNGATNGASHGGNGSAPE